MMSISMERIVCPYSYMRAIVRVSCMQVGSSWESALELATRNKFRLHFVGLLSCMVGVCGRVAISGTLSVYRLRSR